jgi:hypothetical protein
MRAPKGEGLAGWDDLEEHAGGLVCLTGGVEGPVTRRLTQDHTRARDARQAVACSAASASR